MKNKIERAIPSVDSKIRFKLDASSINDLDKLEQIVINNEARNNNNIRTTAFNLREIFRIRPAFGA